MCFVAPDKVQCRPAAEMASFAVGGGVLVAPVAREREVRWVAAASDNVGICGRNEGDQIPQAYATEHQAAVQRWCAATGLGTGPRPHPDSTPCTLHPAP